MDIADPVQICPTCHSQYIWYDNGYHMEYGCPNGPHVYPLWEAAAFVPALALTGLWQLGVVSSHWPLIAFAVPACRLGLIAYFAGMIFGGGWLIRQLVRIGRKLNVAAGARAFAGFMRTGAR